MKKVLVALVLMVAFAMAEVPKIFSVKTEDNTRTNVNLSLTIEVPTEGFLLISYRSNKETNVYLLDGDTIGGIQRANQMSTPSFYEPVTAGEHIVGINTSGNDGAYKQIKILYIPQRQEVSSLKETPTNNPTAIFPLGYVVANTDGTIYDKTGREIMSVAVGEKINIKTLSRGTYYLKSQSTTTKIIIP